MSRFSKITLLLGIFLLIILPTSSVLAAVALENPLKGVEKFDELLTRIIKWLTGIVGLLALLAIVYAGFQMVTAFGDDKKVQSAKTILFWAIGGLVVVALAYTIILTLTSDILGIR